MFSRLVVCSLLALITSPAVPALADGIFDDKWMAKVDPWVIDSGRYNETEFLVFLTEQADLGAAAELPDKESKAVFVHRSLSGTAEHTQGPILEDLAARGVEHRSYWVANMIWVRGRIDTVRAMAERADVAHVYANPSVRVAEMPIDPAADPRSPATVEWNIALVNADDVWAAGVTGDGAVVAGQDTGYLWTHPALVNQYRGGPGNHDYHWHDAIHSGGGSCGPDSPEPCDDHGHGTHTMGTMVGDDGLGNQVGMAPTAQWIGCRNMDQGVGTPATYAECYQFFIAPTDLSGQNPDPTMAPDVINNSWGCPPSEGCTDPNVLLTVVQNVRAAGIVTAHSAGNDGSSCSTVSEPSAIYAESFSVGATTSSDDIASFSSRGPVTIDGSNRLKPDISAPGSNIRSSTRDGGYQGGWSGTSMAAPHVAGLVALLVSANPGIAGDVDTIEEVIEQTAVPLTSSQGCGGIGPTEVPNNVFGWGRIDALAAFNFALDFRVIAAPESTAVCAPADAVFDITIEQFQGFTEPVTLSTAGLPAGASESFTVNPVTPAGISELTVGNTAAVAPGLYTFDIVGTSSPSSIVQQAPVALGVSSAAPDQTIPVSPADGAFNQPLQPTFSWSAATQAGTYTLEIDDDPAFTSPTAYPDISGTSFTPSTDLASNTAYSWRVHADNACGAGPVSPAFTLTTVALPGDCGIGTTPVVPYSEDFETGAAGWSHGGSGDTWTLSGTQVHGGAFSYHATDSSTISNQQLQSPDLVLPTETPLTLQFWNWQEIEDSSSGCYDGATLEISTDAGSTWIQLATTAMQTDPYDGPISTSFSNPLGGQDAWCGDPQDWLRSVVDIDAYAGQTVRFRFSLATDSSVSREGWYIDDVAIQSCVPELVPEIFADGFESGDVSAWSRTSP
jgi:hypothetical protein